MACDNSGPSGIPRLSTQKLIGFAVNTEPTFSTDMLTQTREPSFREVPPHLQRYPQPSPGHAREDGQGTAPPGPSGPTGKLELGRTELR